MKDIEKFTDEVIVAISNKLGADYQVEKSLIAGRDDKERMAVIIRDKLSSEKRMDCVPVLYVENSYNNYLEGMDIDEAADSIIHDYEYSQDFVDNDMPDLMDKEEIYSRVFYKLIGYENNKNRLEDSPHIRVEDLAIAFYVYITEKNHGNFMISNRFVEELELDLEEIVNNAKENTPLLFPEKFYKMSELFMDICSSMSIDAGQVAGLEDCLDVPMYVLTNEHKYHGAAAVLYSDLLYDFCVENDTDVYILPSSIHELIIIPCTTEDCDAHSLRQMVNEANSSIVMSEEILSYSVYIYSRYDRKIKII